MTVKEIDEHCANNPKQFAVNRFAAHVATALSTASTVKPMDDTDDDKENLAMTDTDDDKENSITLGKLAPVKEITSKPSSLDHLHCCEMGTKRFRPHQQVKTRLQQSYCDHSFSIHTTDHPLVEQETSQVHSAAELLPSDVSRFLSIKIASSYKTKTFTFGFRIRTTGPKLKTILKSPALASVKKGESIHFEPTNIPVTHGGDIVHVGDILLKNAKVTHRAHSKSFLSKCKLPDDMPEFDIKLRHEDPLGVKAPILIIRC